MNFILHAFNRIQLSNGTRKKTPVKQFIRLGLFTRSHILSINYVTVKMHGTLEIIAKYPCVNGEKGEQGYSKCNLKHLAWKLNMIRLQTQHIFPRNSVNYFDFFYSSFTQCTLHCFLLLCHLIFVSFFFLHFLFAQLSIKCSFSNIGLSSTSP